VIGRRVFEVQISPERVQLTKYNVDGHLTSSHDDGRRKGSTVNRRSVLFGAGTLVSGVSVLTGTDVLPTREAHARSERTEVPPGAADEPVLVPSTELATRADDGRLVFAFSDEHSRRSGDRGLNPQSMTTFANAFEIRANRVVGSIACYVVPTNFAVDVTLTAGAATRHADQGDLLTDPGDPLRLGPAETLPVDVTVTVGRNAPEADEGAFLLRRIPDPGASR